MSFVGCHGNESCCHEKIVAMGNVAIKYVVMINVAIENVAMKKNCVSTSGDKKFQKDEMKT